MMVKTTTLAFLALFTSLAFSAPVAERGTKHTGQITFFNPGLGACGVTNNDGDLMTAVSVQLFNDFKKRSGNPNDKPICGRKIKAKGPRCSVTVQVQDKCQSCALFDLDLSPAAFAKIADPNKGRVSGITWEFL